MVANTRLAPFLAAVALGGSLLLTLSCASTLGMQDGLVPVQSRYLDDFQLRPNAVLAGYRSVLVDPVPVEFHKNWLRNMNANRAAARRISEGDARRIAADVAYSLRGIVAEAFVRRGYAIATAPGPGVLQLSPKISDLYINAPDGSSRAVTYSYVREVGEATLQIEMRDASTGMLLGRAVHHDTARVMGGLIRADDVSTAFWLEALFKRWARNVAAETDTVKGQPKKLGSTAPPALAHRLPDGQFTSSGEP